MSPREYEAPTGGPAKGISAAPVWDQMLDIYYESMGWDKEGKPSSRDAEKAGAGRRWQGTGDNKIEVLLRQI